MQYFSFGSLSQSFERQAAAPVWLITLRARIKFCIKSQCHLQLTPNIFAPPRLWYLMESSRSLTKGLIKSGKPHSPVYLPTEAYIRVNLVRGAHGWLISYAEFSQPIVPINIHNILRNAIPWCSTWISALYLNRSKVLPAGCINSFLLSAMHLKKRNLLNQV